MRRKKNSGSFQTNQRELRIYLRVAKKNKIKCNKSCREMCSPLHAPSYLVFSISFPPQRSHCSSDSRAQIGMNYFSASLHLRLNLPVMLTELFSVPFHETHFCKKTQRTCVVRGAGQPEQPFPRGSWCFPPDLHHFIKEAFLGLTFKAPPSPLWKGEIWVVELSHFTKFRTVLKSLWALI